MTNIRSRYPGLRPFDAEEQQYFFGRQEEIEAVCRLLDIDSLTILHGSSGMGKSSLINAGILPALGKIRKWNIPYHLVQVRLTNYDPELAKIRREQQGAEALAPDLVKDPVERFIATCLGSDTEWNEVIPMPKDSFWLTAKQLLIDQAISPMRLVFVFDQFEELFTYPEQRVDEFARQLGELYHEIQPEAVRLGIERKKIIDDAQAAEPEEAVPPKVEQLLATIDQPLDVKILISMRSDKLHFLDRLKPYLPEMMLNSYELRSFDAEQAKRAIAEPASLTGDDFASPPFTISESVMDEIMGFLQDKLTRRVDPSQLQIVCQHIERKMIERGKQVKKQTEKAI